MKTCKNCTCVLDEHVIDVKDKRYCKTRLWELAL